MAHTTIRAALKEAADPEKCYAEMLACIGNISIIPAEQPLLVNIQASFDHHHKGGIDWPHFIS